VKFLEKVQFGKHFMTLQQHERPRLCELSSYSVNMSAEEAVVDGTNGPNPGDRHAIGISFGNSNSSIAYTTVEDKAEVIANEDGGMWSLLCLKLSSGF
jgi:hypothetical protein